MKSLYAQYLEERTDIEIIERGFGFVTFSIEGDEVYIRDIYVSSTHRLTGFATSMANEVAEIARKHGCKRMIGSVCPNTKTADASLKILMAYGMKLHSSVQNLIIFKKEIV